MKCVHGTRKNYAPTINDTFLGDNAFTEQTTCYTRYKETFAVIPRLEYYRDKLTMRLWDFNEAADELPDA